VLKTETRIAETRDAGFCNDAGRAVSSDESTDGKDRVVGMSLGDCGSAGGAWRFLFIHLRFFRSEIAHHLAERLTPFVGGVLADRVATTRTQ
jgi:hypothetical protein